ncbi:MAG: hypothetical protein WBW51_05870 [Methyloceanibacter sp.]
MLITPDKIPVRTRLPLAAWAIAAIVTLASLMSSLLHAYDPWLHGMPSAEQRVQPKIVAHQAKV